MTVAADLTGYPRHPSCLQHFPVPHGNPEAFPGLMRYVIPPASSGSPPDWTSLENHQWETPIQSVKDFFSINIEICCSYSVRL